MKNHLINKVKFRSPKNQKEFDEYDFFRWKVLREPLGKKIETLKDKFDKEQISFISWYYIQEKRTKLIGYWLSYTKTGKITGDHAF